MIKPGYPGFSLSKIYHVLFDFFFDDPMNSSNLSKTRQLKQFYQDYIQAFATASIPAVTKCYQLPCVLSTPDKVILLNNVDAFEQEFSAIFSLLAEHKITAFKASNGSYQEVNDTLTIVKLDWRFYDDANNLFSEFSAIYHLSYVQEVFRIINVISHDSCQIADLTHALSLSANE